MAAAAATAKGVAILVNNAGTWLGASVLTGDLADIHLEMNTHYFGTLAVIRAFAPQLVEHDASAILNVLSMRAWQTFPSTGAYCAAKSAAWSMTNSARLELARRGTQVTALHLGYMDTDMARSITVPKNDPAVIAKLALDGLQAGEVEIVADEPSRRVLAAMSAGVAGLYPQLAKH